jgi:hypothetical protein
MARDLACSEPPRDAFTGAEASSGARDMPSAPESNACTVRRRTCRRRRRWRLAKRCAWGWRNPVILYWGCFELDLRYVRHRGWRAVRLQQFGSEPGVYYPSPAGGWDREEKDRNVGAGGG